LDGGDGVAGGAMVAVQGAVAVMHLSAPTFWSGNGSLGRMCGRLRSGALSADGFTTFIPARIQAHGTLQSISPGVVRDRRQCLRPRVASCANE
jgi:hypothetical protein